MLSSIQQQRILNVVGRQDGSVLISRLNSIQGITDAGVTAGRQIYCQINPKTADMKTCNNQLNFETQGYKFNLVKTSDPKTFVIQAKANSITPFFNAMSLDDEPSFMIGCSSEEDSSDNEIETTSFQPTALSYPAVSFSTEFSKATPQQIASQGVISSPCPGLQLAHLTDKDNNIIYFAREEISDKNPTANQWDFVFGEIGALSQNIDDLLHNDPNIKDFLSPLLKNQDLKALTQKVLAASQWDSPEKLAYTIGKVAYAGKGLLFSHKDVTHDKKYILYASTKPINDFAFKNTDMFSSLEEFMAKTKQMAVMVSAAANKDRMVHRGIIKPPASMISCLNANFTHKGIPQGGLSMALHSFGLECARQDKIPYLTVSPMSKMYMMFTASRLFKASKSALTGEEAILKKKLTHLIGPTHRNTLSKKNEIPILLKISDTPNSLFPAKR